MFNSTRLKVATGILVLILGCIVAVWMTVIYPAKKFINEERNSITKFDSLNEEISKEIPIQPSGVDLNKTLSLSIDHGRQLVIYYTVTDKAKLTDKEILSYYQSTLQLKGWETIESDRSIYFRGIELKKKTACILIEFVLTNYEITIWHDYLGQSFSPALPPKWLLEIIDLGKTDIWTCPYE